MNDDIVSSYKGKKVLITGGLGFLGSNMAHELIKYGANVTVLDNLSEGNLFNVEDIKDQIEVIIGDLCDQKLVEKIVPGKDVIFDFAAQVSYLDSIKYPLKDLETNCKGHLILLETCRAKNEKVKILFSSSRYVVGENHNLITEESPTNPLNIYGIHKLTTENYYNFYHKHYGLRTTVFRITNLYGERQQMRHGKYGITGYFLRLAMEGKTIEIYGDGKQLRDYINVKDVIMAFLKAGVTNKTDGELYNCGSGKSIYFKEMAELMIKIAGSGSLKFIPWPTDYKKTEIGSSEISISKLSLAISWSPEVSFLEGIQSMHEYYKSFLEKYI